MKKTKKRSKKYKNKAKVKNRKKIKNSKKKIKQNKIKKSIIVIVTLLFLLLHKTDE